MNDHFGLMLSDDLIFISRVSATAQAQNLEIRAHRDVGELLACLTTISPCCVLIDIQTAGTLLSSMVASIRSASSAYIVAFGSHVDVKSLAAARSCNCDVVLPRSAFAQQLELDLRNWFRATSR